MYRSESDCQVMPYILIPEASGILSYQGHDCLVHVHTLSHVCFSCDDTACRHCSMACIVRFARVEVAHCKDDNGFHSADSSACAMRITHLSCYTC